MRAENKKPLYRKVNTTTHGVWHGHGDDYKNTRSNGGSTSMKQGVRRGLDYTPLFKFLLSKVGESWDDVHSEAVSRLDKQEPIFWMVAKSYDAANEVVGLGENAYFSGLFIDEAGILRIVNPSLNESSFKPLCKCCTHTFNGVPYTRKYPSKP